MPGFSFTGEFTSECQFKSVPPSLMCLVSMLLNGPNIESQDFEESQTCLTIVQLIIFNLKKIKKLTAKSDRHNQDREPPLPLYLGMSVHAQTRSKKFVNQLYELGLSVSYQRIDDIMNNFATSACDHFKSVGIVCPLSLQNGLFTIGAIDNLDHDPSSTRAHFVELGYVCASSQSKIQMLANQQCNGLIYVQPDPLQRVSHCLTHIRQFLLFL